MRQLSASGLVVSLAGAAVGLGLAWVAVAMFDASPLLFRVEKHDPITFVAVPVFLTLVTTVSSVIPALRVLTLDPATTLCG